MNFEKFWVSIDCSLIKWELNLIFICFIHKFLYFLFVDIFSTLNSNFYFCFFIIFFCQNSLIPKYLEEVQARWDHFNPATTKLVIGKCHFQKSIFVFVTVVAFIDLAIEDGNFNSRGIWKKYFRYAKQKAINRTKNNSPFIIVFQLNFFTQLIYHCFHNGACKIR